MALVHTEVSRKFYNSTAWKETRKAYIDSLEVPGMCEICLKYGRFTPGVIVDHQEEININNINDPNITLNWDNFCYMCMTHHNRKTFGHPENNDAIPDGCYFDEHGRLQMKEDDIDEK